MAEKNDQRIERILSKLNQVRQRGLSCFGSDRHRFRLNSPVDEAFLIRFESEHNVTLPSDYRSFLRIAGNGGAGPYYGIYKLDQSNDFSDWTAEYPADKIIDLPSPLHPEMSRENDWESQFNNCASPYQGMISIGTQGCTYEMGLIVTGEFAGRVVYLDADGQAPYVVREPDFLSWYERWLDELLGGYDMFWFGYGLTGNESALIALLNSASTSDLDRAEAVHAIRRLPKLSASGQQRICQLIEDGVPDVRAAACAVIEKFEIAEAKTSLLKLLDDECPKVQMAAISANLCLFGNAACEKVAQLLQSENEEVAKTAFFKLNGDGNLSSEVLLQLTESPHGVIRYCAAHAAKWKRRDEALLLRLLNDEHPQVRFYAVLGLRQIRSRTAIDSVIDLLANESDHHTIDSILRALGELPGRKSADVLIEWANNGGDDHHRLTAIDSLCKLGDTRVKPIAKSLLNESRSPLRMDANGLPVMSNVRSIGELVLESLRASPNWRLKLLGTQFEWLKCLSGSRSET
ncbi:HEAT repeat domain-containing protein [Stieleria sp. JC731]|uniref:HEAT repeat domain-containing protein n=1 Tax=Pirellulaceae TaxID=2691357 RepID=UPI001E4AACD8|nr:HEAT repeat domain-containing protein [Stieleria sp. JC731]MCC9602853.1 HEAT repeat domain-containing protein [Stieleria sp. JC731]